MPTRKIADLPMPCRHPEHDPPKHVAFSPGLYEHECPSCGRRQYFSIDRPTWSTKVG